MNNNNNFESGFKEFDKIQKRINQILAPARNLQQHINQSLAPIRNLQRQFYQSLAPARNLQRHINQILNSANNIELGFEKFDRIQKRINQSLAPTRIPVKLPHKFYTARANSKEHIQKNDDLIMKFVQKIQDLVRQWKKLPHGFLEKKHNKNAELSSAEMENKSEKEHALILEEIEEEYRKLIYKINEILTNLSKYYYEKKPFCRDQTHDKLFKIAEKINAEMHVDNAATEKIGSPANKNFLPFEHPMPMLSLSNAMNFEELNDFIVNTKKNLGMTLPLKKSIEKERALLQSTIEWLKSIENIAKIKEIVMDTKNFIKKAREYLPMVEKLQNITELQQINKKISDNLAYLNEKEKLSTDKKELDKEKWAQWQEITKEITTNVKKVDKNTLTFTLTPKVDGLALELIYEAGKLITAATRGDGNIGETVTRNAWEINGVLRSIESPDFFAHDICKEKIIIRGEVVITKENFQEINRELQQSGKETSISARNLASGSLRQLDYKIVRKRKLTFFAYFCDCLVEGKLEEKYSEQINLLQKWGFKTIEPLEKADNFNDIKKYCENIDKNKESFKFETDGVVVGVDKINDQKKLGFVGKTPRWAIAWKPPTERGFTKIKDVLFQVGRTGIITPVAILKPIELSGATISRATLNNAEEIKKNDFRVGDEVDLIRSGGVIPKILNVKDIKNRDGSERKIFFPENCPCCEGKLVKNVHDHLYYCKNEKCSSRFLQRMLHFVSKQALNIENIGPSLLKKLIGKGLLKRNSDLFYLKKEDLFIENHSKEKNAEKLFQNIQAAKKISLQRFIYALGIPNTGTRSATLLAKKYQTLENFLKISDEKEEELLDLSGFGKEITKQIVNFLKNEEINQDIKEMINLGLQVLPHVEIKEGPLKNEIIIFTGRFSTPRHILAKKAQEAGATILASVNKNTTILIAGEKPTANKIETAKKMNIAIINQQELDKRIGF